MLQPSYRELMDEINKDGNLEDLASRYAVVIAIAKRARQIINGDDGHLETDSNKAVSKAVKEMYEGLIEVYPDEAQLLMEEAENTLEDFDKEKYQSLDDILGVPEEE